MNNYDPFDAHQLLNLGGAGSVSYYRLSQLS